MTLKIKVGDLFEHATANCIIAHGCNAQGVMGSGFALEIKKRFPDAFKVYRRAYETSQFGELETGRNIAVLCEPSVIVVNCITQRFFGSKERREIDYYALRNCLNCLLRYANTYPIHLPLIGGHLGGGEREVLIDIMRHVFLTVDATLWELQ